MKVMIMEDEPSNVKRICRLLKIVDNDIDIVFIAESVEESVRFLTSGNIMPDLIFADIQLADGLCFTVFDKVKTDIPVIFITAFDNYALKAFEYNSLSYIIKPVTEKELRMAMEKVRRIAHPFSVPDIMTQLHRMASGQGLYLNRVLLEQPDGFVPADVEELGEAPAHQVVFGLEFFFRIIARVAFPLDGGNEVARVDAHLFHYAGSGQGHFGVEVHVGHQRDVAALCPQGRVDALQAFHLAQALGGVAHQFAARLHGPDALRHRAFHVVRAGVGHRLHPHREVAAQRQVANPQVGCQATFIIE